MATTKTHAKEELHPFIWEQGAVNVLRDAKLMGLHELDDGLAAYLEKCHYQRLPGGVEPLETWATDDPSTPSLFCVVAHYGHITIVVQIQDVYGLRSWMEKYIPIAVVLPEVVIERPAMGPNNVVTEYTRASGRW